MGLIKNAFSKKGISNATNRFMEGLSQDSGASANTRVITGVKNFFTPQRAYAAEPAQSDNPDYQWVDNGQGGINYFKNGQPISNSDYQAGTGIDTNKLEAAHYQEWINSKPQVVSNDTSASRNSSASVAQYAADQNGNLYNLSDPRQYQAYTDAKNAYIDQQYNDNLSKSMQTIQRNKENLDTTRSNLQKSKKRMFGDTSTGEVGTYQQDLNTLGDTRDQNQQGVMGKFLNLGQNVYQSAEGDNLDQVKNIYNEGITQANQEAQDATDNFNTTQRDIDRTAADLAKEEVDTPNYYNQWRAQNKAQNTVDFKNAQAQLEAKNSSIASSTPTFQEKTFNFLNNAVSSYNQMGNAANKNVYNSIIAPNLAKNNGLTLSSGNNLYKDIQTVANADDSDASKAAVENVYKKYGLLN